MLPPVEDEPEAWIGLLRFVGSRLAEPGVLLPMGDPQTLLTVRHEQLLRPLFRFVLPARETVEQIVDKRSQYAVAREAGIPVPDTYYPASADEVRSISAELPFPVLLKPYQSHVGLMALGQKVVVASSTQELVSAYERLAAREVPAMVEHIVPGEDRALFGYLAFWDDDGREVAWLTKRKLRQNPPGFGDGSLQVTAEAPEVAELSRRLLRAFDYRGFAGVEFKLDAASGTHYLMEVDPGTVSGQPAGSRRGRVLRDRLPIPGRARPVLAGGSLETFKPRVKYVNEELGPPCLPRSKSFRFDAVRSMGPVDPRREGDGHLGPGRSAARRGRPVATSAHARSCRLRRGVTATPGQTALVTRLGSDTVELMMLYSRLSTHPSRWEAVRAGLGVPMSLSGRARRYDARVDDEPRASVVCVGRSERFERVLPRVFPRMCPVATSRPRFLWSPRRLSRLTADVVAVELHPWLAARFRKAGWAVVPQNIRWRSILTDIPPSRLSRSLRENLKRVARLDCQLELVSRPSTADLREFRVEMVQPLARKRFGSLAWEPTTRCSAAGPTAGSCCSCASTVDGSQARSSSRTVTEPGPRSRGCGVPTPAC